MTIPVSPITPTLAEVSKRTGDPTKSKEESWAMAKGSTEARTAGGAEGRGVATGVELDLKAKLARRRARSCC